MEGILGLEATPEMLSRTRPNLIDLLVAILAGFAGSYALIDEKISPALPGEAIATAIVPPLANSGLCFSLGAILKKNIQQLLLPVLSILSIMAMIETSIGLPVENAIGTQVMTTWIEHAKGSEFRREHAFVEPVNDEKGKPVNILRMVSKRPIIAMGNSEGDRDMLEYSDDKNPATPDLQMIVNHDDQEREYEYAVEKVNQLAAENGWQVISMKNDWQRVFDFSK